MELVSNVVDSHLEQGAFFFGIELVMQFGMLWLEIFSQGSTIQLQYIMYMHIFYVQHNAASLPKLSWHDQHLNVLKTQSKELFNDQKAKQKKASCVRDHALTKVSKILIPPSLN